jgi:hypothetical protein
MDTGRQMILQEDGLELLDGLAHRIRLAKNIEATPVIVDHLANTVKVSFDIVYSLENILLLSTHRHPPIDLPL